VGEGTGGERGEYILGKTRKGLRGKGSRLNKAQLHTKRQKRAFEKESENNSNYETVWEVRRGGILEKTNCKL